MANVSTHQLELSAMDPGCNDNNNGDGKPTATMSTLANDSTAAISTTTTATATNIAIYRLGHTAAWECMYPIQRLFFEPNH